MKNLILTYIINIKNSLKNLILDLFYQMYKLTHNYKAHATIMVQFS